MTSAFPRHALIIEDEAIIALEIEALLREMGFRSFDVAASPGEALQLASQRRPELITADVRIIGGTGIEALQSIRKTLGPIPHVYVTGNLDMLVEVDASAVVEKPISAIHFRRACAAVTGAAQTQISA